MIFTNLSKVGANKYRAFSLIGALLFVQFVFGVVFGGGWEWVGDVAGFAAGFLLSFVVSPGGFRRVLDQVRQRWRRRILKSEGRAARRARAART